MQFCGKVDHHLTCNGIYMSWRLFLFIANKILLLIEYSLCILLYWCVKFKFNTTRCYFFCARTGNKIGVIIGSVVRSVYQYLWQKNWPSKQNWMCCCVLYVMVTCVYDWRVMCWTDVHRRMVLKMTGCWAYKARLVLQCETFIFM